MIFLGKQKGEGKGMKDKGVVKRKREKRKREKKVKGREYGEKEMVRYRNIKGKRLKRG